MSEIDWNNRAKALLKAELKRRDISYRELAESLTKAGTPTTEPSLNNKISRGGFSAAFFLQCLAVIGASQIILTD